VKEIIGILETLKADAAMLRWEPQLSTKHLGTILTALKAGQAWADAHYEWAWLADKGDGMPVEVEDQLAAAEAALSAAYTEAK
jgi:hypothetical protein